MTPGTVDRIVVWVTVATGNAGRSGPGLSALERYETLRVELTYVPWRLRLARAWMLRAATRAIRRQAWRVIRWSFRLEGLEDVGSWR